MNIRDRRAIHHAARVSLAGDGTKIFRLPAFGAPDIRSRARDKEENRQDGFL